MKRLMQKPDLAQQLQDQDFQYRTFYQNLAEKLDSQEITSLNVLGKDFFRLIDHVATELLISRAEDCFLLEMSLQEFLWELQIFVNQYIRQEAGTILKLRYFCSDCLERLQEETFNQKFMKRIQHAYAQRFFIQESNNAYLV